MAARLMALWMTGLMAVLMAVLVRFLAQFLARFLARSVAGGYTHCGHSSLGFLTGHSVSRGGAEFPIFLTWLTIRRQYVGLAVPYG
jgi:hypothetical protein